MERSVPKFDRLSVTQLAADTPLENSTPSGASFVCRTGMPPPVEYIVKPDILALLLRSVQRDARLRSHVRSHDSDGLFIRVVPVPKMLEESYHAAPFLRKPPV